jgi:hypothetical protein
MCLLEEQILRSYLAEGMEGLKRDQASLVKSFYSSLNPFMRWGLCDLNTSQGLLHWGLNLQLMSFGGYIQTTELPAFSEGGSEIRQL